MEHTTAEFDALLSRALPPLSAASSTASSVNPTLPNHSPPRRSGSCTSGGRRTSPTRKHGFAAPESGSHSTPCARPAPDALRSAVPPPAHAPHNPEDDLARTQEQERVRQVLAVMKPDHAALLMLRAEGLSYQELAAALRPQSRLRRHDARARGIQVQTGVREHVMVMNMDAPDHAPRIAPETKIAGSTIACACSIRRKRGSPHRHRARALPRARRQAATRPRHSLPGRRFFAPRTRVDLGLDRAASLACLILLLTPTTRAAAQRLWDVFFAERVEFVRLDIDKLPRSLTEQNIRLTGAHNGGRQPRGSGQLRVVHAAIAGRIAAPQRRLGSHASR